MAPRRDRTRTEDDTGRVELPGIVVWDDATWPQRARRAIGRLLGRRNGRVAADPKGEEPSKEKPTEDVDLGDDVTPPPHSTPATTPRPGVGAGRSRASTRRDTLHLLPGRLRPVDPEIVRQEIRLLRTSARVDQVVTLGWDPGEPPDHVTIDHPSVQGRHARMHYSAGKWAIESLIQSDPVRVNGTQVRPSDGPHALSNGDRVRIGRAEFDFLIP